MDLYVLSTHKHLFGDPRFRIVRVYDYETSYGAVMAGQAMKQQHCFTEKIKEDAADVFKSIDENVEILKVLRTFRPVLQLKQDPRWRLRGMRGLV